MNAADAERLGMVFRRESRTFLQYVQGSAPLAFSPAERTALKMVHECAATEQDALDRFADWLDEQRISPPHPGGFPSAFTDFNFLAVNSLLPKLADEQRRGVAVLEDDLKSLEDADARDAVAGLLRFKRAHLERLEAAQKPV